MNSEIEIWFSKVQAMPNIPNSDTEDGFIDSLKVILEALENDVNPNTILQFKGSKSKRTLNELCIYLKPVGIVKKESLNGKWLIAEACKEWKSPIFKEKLAVLFSKRIKYFSELLAFLKTPRNKHEILEDSRTYNLYWKEHSQIYSRLLWMRDLKLVEPIVYENKFIITEKGLKFLSNNPAIDRNILIDINFDETEKENDFEFKEWEYNLINFNWKDEERIHSISYIPGGYKTAIYTILDVLNSCRNVSNDDILSDYIEKTFDVKGKFVSHLFTFLTRMQLLDRLGIKTYKTSEIGIEILESFNPDLSLVFVLHNTFYYVMEILVELDNQPRSVKELTSLSVTKYSMEKESIDQIRKRLSFLRNAKLIMDDKDKKICLTKRGKLLVNKIYELDIDITEQTDKINERKDISILSELRISSVDSSNPKQFEKIVNKYFSLLGFETKYYGESGTTDILLTAPTVPKFTFKVAVEVKTNWEGKITEKIINFDTLKEHKRKHDADYMVVIGKEFVGERVIERAITNKILFIDIKALEELYKNHSQYPLQPVEYKPIFEQYGLVDLSVLTSEYVEQDRRRNLFQSIVKVLIENSNDTYSKGLLSKDNIYFLIKSNEIFNERPLVEDELINMLNLLSNPLIGCVGIDKSSKKYYAKGSIDDAALKFSIYNNTNY